VTSQVRFKKKMDFEGFERVGKRRLFTFPSRGMEGGEWAATLEEESSGYRTDKVRCAKAGSKRKYMVEKRGSDFHKRRDHDSKKVSVRKGACAIELPREGTFYRREIRHVVTRWVRNRCKKAS